ncbi:LysR family transcriptional regulator [Ramlibacter sp. AW1]|uniref:LysR family transcriptional regulator n=1 Tax=Ramlibacter aurantiacus TaxID=2801330 RepID=A0A936ZSW1_9BURK|nr:LysR family transcriptional regulator [Ramlibacter aurantiacus]MBL0421946.1 LysR family transcriptional regulator [Ramlibacter aurantiacus]
MAKLDVEWLAVFDRIYTTGSVSRSAEELGVAQATASIALNKLRTHFGDPLFIRTSRGMEPTPRAQQLQPQLRLVLDTLEAARGASAEFDPLRARRAFRLCMADISDVVILPTLLNHLRRVAPGICIESEKITPDAPKRLESGEIHLALGFMPHLEAGFYQQTLFMQRFVGLAARDHPRIGDRLTWDAFQSEQHILVDMPGTGHSIIDRVLSLQGVQRNIALRVSSYLGVARIVAQTELMVIVPDRLGEAMGTQEQVRLLELPCELPRYAVKQHWHARFHADPANIWLRRTIAELFGGSGD